MRGEIESLLGKGGINIVVDLSKVSDMDSSGLTIFTSLQKRIDETKGSLKFANVQPFVMDLFKITGLNDIFEIYPSVKDALATYENTSEFTVRRINQKFPAQKGQG